MTQKFGAILEIKDQFSSSLSKFNEGVGLTEQKVESATKKSSKFGAGLKKAGKVAVGAAAGIAAAGTAAGGAMFAMGNKFAGTADEIDKTAMKMGISTDALQEYRFAMGQVGVSEQSFGKAIERTNQRMGLAEAGNEKYKDALDAMGVSLTNNQGKMRSTDAVFMDAVTSLSKMENSQKQAALASEFFGVKTSRELMPAIKAGGGAIEDLRGEAHSLGAVIGGESVQAGVLFGDTMDKAKNALTGLGNSIAAQTLPVLQKMLDIVINNMPAITGVFNKISDVAGTVFTWIGETGISIFNSLKTKIQENKPVIDRIKETAIEFGGVLKAAFDKAKPVINWLKDEGLPLATDAVFNILEKAMDLKDYIQNNWSVIAPLVTGIVVAFGTWKAITIAQTAVTTTMTIAQKGLNKAMKMNPMGMIVTLIGLLIGAGILLYKNWDTVKAKAGELWSSIKKFFGNILDWGKEVWDGVKEKIGSAMESAGTAVSNFFSPLMDFIASAKNTWDSFTGALSNFSMPKAVSSAISAVGGVAGKIGGFINGSHATGLNRVPHDGYIAELHKDETVLPKREADVYRKQGLSKPTTIKNPASNTTNNQSTTNTNSNTFNINITAQNNSVKEIMDELIPQVKIRMANI